MDTGAIIKLYVRELFSRNISEKLKQFREEIALDEADRIMTKFDVHETKGVYFRPLMA